MCDAMDVTVLCKVVDNYGDIGFVYRLFRSLRECRPSWSVRLVVRGLRAFSLVEPSVSADLPVQELCRMRVFDWDAAAECSAEFRARPPSVVLECFQCGRPDWLDGILFSPSFSESRSALVVNVEYLTAESWADEFHLLPSATRSRRVKKVNFMPGFSPKTGGLVLDADFMRCAESKSHALSCLDGFLAPQSLELLSSPEAVCVLVFAYPRDFSPVIEALSLLSDFERNRPHPRSVHVFSAASGFSDACRKNRAGFGVESLAPLSQKRWDALLCSCDFLFVRGEDSFSRACLCGTPFLWEAYVQEKEFQLVKVRALLLRMEPFFNADDFRLVSSCMISYNRTDTGREGPEASDAVSGFPDAVPYGASARSIFSCLCAREDFSRSFRSFACSLIENGNLTEHLCAFVDGCNSKRNMIE